MTAAPQFLRDLAVSRILRSSSPRPKGALERHDLTRFRRLTLHTAQASISLRRFSNASPRWHIQRLKRDLIAQLERVIVSVAGFGLPGSPRLQKASFDGEEFPKYPTRFTNKAKLRCSPTVLHTVDWCYRAIAQTIGALNVANSLNSFSCLTPRPFMLSGPSYFSYHSVVGRAGVSLTEGSYHYTSPYIP